MVSSVDLEGRIGFEEHACQHDKVVCNVCLATLTQDPDKETADVDDEKKSVAAALETTYFEVSLPRLIWFQQWSLFYTFVVVIASSMWMYNVQMNQVPCTDTNAHIPRNFLPCVSATISVEPQRYIFRIAVGIVLAGPGFFHMLSWFNLLRSRIHNFEQRISGWTWIAKSLLMNLYSFSCWVSMALHFLMGLGMITTTYVMNREIFIWHAMGTTSFLVFQNMFCPLHTWLILLSRPPHPTALEVKATKIKVRCWIASWVCTALLLLAWQGHVVACLDFAHSWFSFFEYIVIALSLLFHYAGIYDFHDVKFSVGPPLALDFGRHPKNI